MSKRIYRWEIPGHYDQLPYGTEIVRIKSVLYGDAQLYKQVSKDHNHPQWISIGLVVEDTADDSRVCGSARE